MNYLPYAIAATLLMSIGNFIQKLVLRDKEIHGGVFAGAYGLLVALLTLPFGLFYEKISFQMFDSNVVIVIMLMTCLYAVAMWGFFTSMKHIPISEIIFLESATPIWVLIGSTIFLGETFSWNKALGVSLVIGGLLVVFQNKGVKRWNKYHTLGLFSGLFYAGAYMADKHLLGFIPPLTYQVFSFALPSIAILVFFSKRIHELRYFIVDKKARRIIWSSVFVGFSYYTLFSAYQLSNEISLINPIFETKAIWVMILGLVFLKEREHLYQKIIGVFLAIGGVILVS